MNLSRSELSALVLAGGQARRMGGSKCERSVGGRSLLERSLAVATAVSDDVLLLPGRREVRAAGDWRVVPDWPDVPGPVGALGAGLSAARHEWCLLLPCDMPFASAAVVDRLAGLAGRGEADVIALDAEGGLQPFHALYRRRLADRVAELAAGGTRSLRELLARLPVRVVSARSLTDLEPDLRFLRNVNTPADLAAVANEEIPT